MREPGVEYMLAPGEEVRREAMGDGGVHGTCLHAGAGRRAGRAALAREPGPGPALPFDSARVQGSQGFMMLDAGMAVLTRLECASCRAWTPWGNRGGCRRMHALVHARVEALGGHGRL